MPKPTVCLAMILKNESQIIKRCLDSAKPYIDGYFIIDTGSTDNTMEIVAEELKDLPGTLKQEEWVDFGHNRTSLVQQAQEQGYDYLLLGDADMVFDGDLGDLTENAYLIRLSGGFEYHMPYLVSSKYHWHYHGVTHEFLGSDEPLTFEKHPTFIIHHLADGGTRPEKWTRDRELLEKEWEREPNNDRTTFYLAQTCKDMGDYERSITLYKHRVEIGGWEEEVYWSLFQIGEMTGNIEDYLRAWCYRPSRPEATHRLMRSYNEKELYRAAYVMGTLATGPWAPGPTQDILFVERWAEDYGIKFEHAVAAWWIGSQEESIAEFKELLSRDDLPDHYREACRNNLTNCGVTE